MAAGKSKTAAIEEGQAEEEKLFSANFLKLIERGDPSSPADWNELGIPVQRETVGYSLSKTDGFGFQDIPSPPPPSSPPVRGKYLKI